MKLIIDFTIIAPKLTLFTGKSNGAAMRSKFDFTDATEFKLITNDKQLLTSSFIMGLLEPNLRTYLAINELKDTIDVSEVTDTSKEEVHRALNRIHTYTGRLVKD